MCTVCKLQVSSILIDLSFDFSPLVAAVNNILSTAAVVYNYEEPARVRIIEFVQAVFESITGSWSRLQY